MPSAPFLKTSVLGVVDVVTIALDGGDGEVVYETYGETSEGLPGTVVETVSNDMHAAFRQHVKFCAITAEETIKYAKEKKGEN